MAPSSGQPSENWTTLVLCPRCPICGGEPSFLSPQLAQTFCTSDDCNVLCWNPWRPAAENLRDMGAATVQDMPAPDAGDS